MTRLQSIIESASFKSPIVPSAQQCANDEQPVYYNPLIVLFKCCGLSTKQVSSCHHFCYINYKQLLIHEPVFFPFLLEVKKKKKKLFEACYATMKPESTTCFI